MLRASLQGSLTDDPALFGVAPGGAPWVITRGLKVAMWGAIAAFVAAAAMLVLTFLGFAHMRRAPADQEVGLSHAAPSTA